MASAPEQSRNRWLRLAWLGLVLVIAAIVYARGLALGYIADDFWQLAAVEGRFGPHRDPLSNYTFVFERAATVQAHRQRGSLPWWTTDDWHFGMLRPLSSLTLEVDYRLFPRRPLLSHLHSYLWFAAMLVAAERFMRRVFVLHRVANDRPPAAFWVPALALVCFAIDESQGYTLMWIANRCALVSATFALLAIDAHLEAGASDDEDARRAARRREWLWWALAFAGGEYATCGAAYLLAYELVGRDDGWRSRLWALVPATACTAVFVVLYLLYGASSMGLAEYADPFVETGRFFRELGYKLPRLAAEVWTSVPADHRELISRSAEYEWLWRRVGPEGVGATEGPWRHAALSGVALLAMGVALVAALWGAPTHVRRTATWCALGSLLGLVPVSSTMPQPRLLMFAGLGPAIVFALLTERAVAGLRALSSAGVRARIGHVAIALLALLAVGLDVVVESVTTWRAHGRMQEITGALRTMWARGLAPDEVDESKQVVVLAAPEFMTTVHGYGMSNVYFERMPAGWHTLAFGQRAYLARRTDDDVLEINAIGEGMFTHRDERSFRRASEAFELGDRVDVGLYEAEIWRMHPSGGVQAVRFHFDRSLDDPSLVLLMAKPRGLTRIDAPPVGGSLVVPLGRLPDIEPP